ncbi:hypothetical protein GYB59_05150 [bacterium]|nr:hypothetical protein [bacterium]
MTITRTLVSVCLLAVGLISLSGCGGSQAPDPDLVPVSGTVTLNGKPAAEVTVAFNPSGTSENATRQPSFAVTDFEGKYALKHRNGEEGAEPGEYMVTFSKYEMPDGSPPPAGSEPEAVGAKQALPERYLSIGEDAETATVESSATVVDFSLQSR